MKKADLDFLRLHFDRILAMQGTKSVIAINSIIYIYYTITILYIHSYTTFLVSVSESLFSLFFIILQKERSDFNSICKWKNLYFSNEMFIYTPISENCLMNNLMKD